PVANASGLSPPWAELTDAPNVPSPLPKKTLTPLLATTKSALPSTLKSPTATDVPDPAARYGTAARNVLLATFCTIAMLQLLVAAPMPVESTACVVNAKLPAVV